MQIYLVGGAVRDRLLGLPVGERDWVVVGATPDDLERQGFRRVGRDFPVFLHPETGEEYALARTERKTAPGYRGFEVQADPSVTLEDDLLRRDLTLNAMAEAADGTLIDPFGGREHLRQRLLQHVSDAFREDPVRILRVARFAARFHTLGFRVAPPTMALMTDMVRSGEAGALVPERVWQETENALGTTRPDVYFEVLRDCGALAVIFPELEALFGVPQPAQWHPEIDTGVHVMMCLHQAAQRDFSREVRFAVLLHDLGKGTTPRDVLPKHIGHEQRSVKLAHAVCVRLGVPNRYRELAASVAAHHGLFGRALELRAATVLELLERLDAFRASSRVQGFLDACEADVRGRTGFEDREVPQRAFLEEAVRAARAVTSTSVRQTDGARELEGTALGAALRAARIEAVESVRRRHGAGRR